MSAELSAACAESAEGCADCETNHGGCDPLASCTQDGEKAVCGPCPKGYSGSGGSSLRCEPELLGLDSSAGVLSPAFSRDILRYELRSGVGAAQVTLTPKVVPGVEVRINGTLFTELSPPEIALDPFQTRTVKLTLRGENGRERDYEVAIARGFVQEAFLKASNAGAGDWFGMAVATDGTSIVVGAPFEANSHGGKGAEINDSEDAPGSGAVYVFRKTDAGWIQEGYLKALNPVANDNFGAAVAVDGDVLVVGAIASAIDPEAPPDASRTDWAGSAYVFRRGPFGWQQEAFLKPEASDGFDLFGIAVAVSGELVAVGAQGESSGSASDPFDNSLSYGGAVYVYERTSVAFTWGLKAYVKSPDLSANQLFGGALTLSDDFLFVGAPGLAKGNIQDSDGVPPRGAVYVFDRATLSPLHTIEASGNDLQNGFGGSLAFANARLAVGAPNDQGSLPPEELTDVGTGSGAVYVYEFRDDKFELADTVWPGNPSAEDSFGAGVAWCGETLVVAAAGEDGEAQGVGNPPGGDGTLSSGAAYAFFPDGMGYAPGDYLKADNAAAGDYFGTEIACSGDTLVVSAFAESTAAAANGQTADTAPESGAAYVFY